MKRVNRNTNTDGMNKLSKLPGFCFVVILFFLSSCEADRPLLDEVGVSSSTFRTQFFEDAETTLDMIREMGVANIEFSSLYGNTPEELRAMLDERDMTCTSLGIDCKQLMENADVVIANAQKLGAKFVRVERMLHNGESAFTSEDARRVVADLNRVGKVLHQHGIMLCYHNYADELKSYEKSTLFDYMVNNTNPDYVGFQMDIFCFAKSGTDPVAYLQQYPDRFWLMSIKDLHKQDADKQVVVGDGTIDIPAVLAAARETSIKHFYIDDKNEKAKQHVPQSLTYLKGLSLDDVAAYVLVHETIGNKPGR